MMDIIDLEKRKIQKMLDCAELDDGAFLMEAMSLLCECREYLLTTDNKDLAEKVNDFLGEEQ